MHHVFSSIGEKPYFKMNSLSNGEPVKGASDIRCNIRPGSITVLASRLWTRCNLSRLHFTFRSTIASCCSSQVWKQLPPGWWDGYGSDTWEIGHLRVYDNNWSVQHSTLAYVSKCDMSRKSYTKVTEIWTILPWQDGLSCRQQAYDKSWLVVVVKNENSTTRKQACNKSMTNHGEVALMESGPCQ